MTEYGYLKTGTFFPRYNVIARVKDQEWTIVCMDLRKEDAIAAIENMSKAEE